MIGFFIIIILGIFISYGLKKSKYDKSNYKKESGNSYWAVMMDKGKYGEYLSFNALEKIKGEHRILTNVYLPKENGETTEIDLVYIHETGIYVLESKNYSGWIFGDEKSKTWMQTLQNGQKEKFYNPIWQNKTHIKYLIKLLNIDERLVKSIIVFSERCTIKKLEVHSENVKVINRYDLNKTIEKIINNSPKVFEGGKIIELYYELKPYTCVNDEVKENHIEQIKQKQNFEFNSEKLNINIRENVKVKAPLEDVNENRKALNLENNVEAIAVKEAVKIEVSETLEEKLHNDFEIKPDSEINTLTNIYKKDDEIYELLKEYRKKVSTEEHLKAFMVFNNQELNSIVENKPKNKEELIKIKGFGPKKIEKYGEGILKIVNE